MIMGQVHKTLQFRDVPGRPDPRSDEPKRLSETISKWA